MPSKDRAVGVDAEADVDFDDSPRETRSKIKSEKKEKDRDRDKDKDSERKRERRKERERERDREQGRERDKDSTLSTHRPHLKSSRSSKSKPTDSETHSHSHRRHRTKTKEREGTKEGRGDRPESPSMANLVPELTRTHLSSTDRISIPYPTFSKAHSKEYVQSKEDVSLRTGRGTDPLTPEPTDLGSSEMRRTKSADSPARKVSSSQKKASRKDARPPTPPDTDSLAPKERDDGAEPRPRSRASYASRSTTKDDKSRVSKVSSQATFVKSPGFKPPYFETSRGAGKDRSRSSTPRSPATDIPVRHGSLGRRPTSIEVTDFSPESAPDSSPKTPTQTTQFPPPPLLPNDKQPSHIRFDGIESNEPTPSQTPANDFPSRPPPPPPPPPLNIQEAPRVDYLLQNGGLPQAIPRQFLAALPRQNGTRPSNPPLRGTETLFAPFFNLLEQYQTVLSSSGSIAVATGHRTVARRLLDRLENVFSRDLPPEGCSCVVCVHAGELHRGLGWGEVLEKVSGRTDLPQWPPFDLASMAGKATEEIADLPVRPASPVKMDPDIAEEFRDHYLRQSKRVRSAVDKWMSSVAESPVPPPQDVDDETLSFAILTSLEQEDRPYFNALLLGSREVQPTVRAPTPLRRPRNDFVIKSGLALQRLYRLQQAPRDAETAVYLVKNPHMHDLLCTITDINTSEWEILTSGRFDGFLWTGADNDDTITPTAEVPSRGGTPAGSGFFPPQRATMSPAAMARHTPGLGGMGSRTTTPFGPYSRGATPASFVSMSSAASSTYPSRHAVSNDEETELAALAEVEREIFSGMEALEDAFEMLHRRAEGVRTALRQRGAGLQVSLQQRRGFGASGIDVLPSSGGSAGYERPAWAVVDEESTVAESESDWGGDDIELAPDDSASNISSSRHRRPKRRNERRTPAPIEEEEE